LVYEDSNLYGEKISNIGVLHRMGKDVKFKSMRYLYNEEDHGGRE
jgi:hypothetical protein